MNGHFAEWLLWLVAGLVTLLEIVLGMLWKAHLTGDKEHRDMVDAEILRLRSAVHDLRDKISEVSAIVHMRQKR